MVNFQGGFSTQTQDKFRIIGANLLKYDDPENLDMNMSAMKSILEQDKNLSPRALTLFLHKLSMLEKNYIYDGDNKNVILKIIFMLPMLAKDKTCVASVLAFINRHVYFLLR